MREQEFKNEFVFEGKSNLAKRLLPVGVCLSKEEFRLKHEEAEAKEFLSLS